MPEDCVFMNTRHATQAIAGLIATLVVAVTPSARQTMPAVPFPEGFRSWPLVRSTVVGPESPTFPKRGGIHHYYANLEALEGYRTGTFPNGSVIVDEAVSTKAGEGHGIGMLFETDRRFLDVMVRNDAQYKDTGGWGFEAFKAGDPKQRVVQDGGKACFVCHAPHAANNFLFTKGLN